MNLSFAFLLEVGLGRVVGGLTNLHDDPQIGFLFICHSFCIRSGIFQALRWLLGLIGEHAQFLPSPPCPRCLELSGCTARDLHAHRCRLRSDG